MKVAIVAPHPDDAILGCGGTIAKHIDKGNIVTVYYVTSGEKGGDPKIREKEALRACDVLGVAQVEFLRLEEGNINHELHITDEDVVYIPHGLEAHRDHQKVHSLVRASCQVWEYEVWTPILFLDKKVDITKYMDIKMKALKEFKTQLKILPNNEAAKCLNRYRAITNSVGKYCECFQEGELHG